MIRRQVQQRKRLVCELKAVERELKAVEVFLKRLFCHNFHQILKHPHLRFRNHRDLSGTAKGGQPVSRCVTLFATVLWNLWKGTVSIHADVNNHTGVDHGHTVSMRKTFNKRGLVSQKLSVWLVGKWNLSANIICPKNSAVGKGNTLLVESYTRGWYWLFHTFGPWIVES